MGTKVYWALIMPQVPCQASEFHDKCIRSQGDPGGLDGVCGPDGWQVALQMGSQ